MNEEVDCRLNDAINMMKKLELYISNNQLHICVHAFKHIVGNTTNNAWLRSQLSANPGRQNNICSLRIKSKFDYNSGVFTVVSASIDEEVQALSL